MTHAASTLTPSHVKLTSIVEVLCRHFDAPDSKPLVDSFSRCEQDQRARILGAVDSSVLAAKAGFSALNAVLEQELPATAVRTLGEGGVLQAGPALRSGRGLVDGIANDRLDAAACIGQLASGRPLVVTDAERVSSQVRNLAVDMVLASASDVRIAILALPPSGRLWTPSELTRCDFALVGIAEGSAEVQITGPGRTETAVSTRPMLSSPYGLLSRIDLGNVSAGHWIAMPKAEVQNLQVQAGEQGVVIPIIRFCSPTWYQLMEFAMQAAGAAVNRPADLDADTKTAIPSAEELIGLKQAYLKSRWAWAMAPRTGRVADVMAVPTLSEDDWLKVRPERRYTSFRRKATARPRLPSQIVGEASINGSAIVYECSGELWEAPIGHKAWIEEVLALACTFRGADLPLTGTIDATMRLVLLKHMLKLGLLTRGQP